MIRFIQRLLKYTSIKHIDYQLLIDSFGKPEKHLSMFNIVHIIDNCRAEFFAAHHDYIEKFQVIELQQELTTI
ncbi:unnamed protein product [Rotaria sordida]|uniref:Uncharacterized protein n=2 Tax=Rotaria sordida TaxID=392033 RepID=A0A816BDI4_9BILA|nr:unnamed protein product [Rotaria sordida]CAF1495454.1 unnamed protein product [Rotaria sordida]CAF1609041.1 unnamed protein product [Rotaria sordida]CAF4223892.1 unnamed protein product [Rotaria sordida]